MEPIFKIGSKNWLVALGASAFLRYNNRLDFCANTAKVEFFKKKRIKSNA